MLQRSSGKPYFPARRRGGSSSNHAPVMRRPAGNVYTSCLRLVRILGQFFNMETL